MGGLSAGQLNGRLDRFGGITSWTRVLLLMLAVSALAVLFAPQAQAELNLETLGVSPNKLESFEAAMTVQDGASPELLSRAGVVGTAIGVDEAGDPVIKILTETAPVFGLPVAVEGVPVEVVITGQIVASHDPLARNRPANAGDSIGHPNITAGTLGAMVTNGSSWYILSNNHILANENAASIGDPTLQPGTVDGGNVGGDEIATLADYAPLAFCGVFCPSNAMDAAIAQITDLADVSVETWCGWTPASTVASASVGQQVKKCGRTTGSTTGEVTAINATIDVLYASGRVARFTNQVVTTDMSAGGDSGSLIVEQGTDRPVALLFAGGTTRTIASPIQPVLDEFGVRFDRPPPAAAFSGTPTSGVAPLTVDFTDESSGSPTSWSWDFDSDGTVDSTSQNPSFTYTSPGSYTVVLTVQNEDGSDTETKTSYITVTESTSLPIAAFSGTPTSGVAPLTVDFTDESSGSPASWSWDFDGDGTVDSTSQNPSFTYASPGSYTVALTVDNDDGSDTETKTNYITVQSTTPPPPPPPPPTPLPPSGDDTPAATDLNVELSASSARVARGDVVSLRATVRDKHPAWGATGVTLTIDLPNGAVVESTKTNRGPGCKVSETVVCDLDFLLPGLTATADLLVRFTEVGEAVSTATVSSAEVDLDPSDNEASAQTVVEAAEVKGISTTPLRVAVTGRKGNALRPVRGRRVSVVTTRLWVNGESTIRVRVLSLRKSKPLKLLRRSRVGKSVSDRVVRNMIYAAPRAKGVRLKLRLRTAGLKRGRTYRIEVRAIDSSGQKVRKIIRFRA